MKKLGFGLMRLPMKDKDVDYEETSKMVDLFLKEGFTYFDTAHGYIDGLSEVAANKCLTSRYPRDKYLLANKLTEPYFEKEEDIRPFFEKQLEICGVEYFDYYLMHAQNARNYEKYKACNAYEVALRLKEEGKIRHLGFSFHDTPETLDKILTEKPFVEFVQLQFNYLDYDSDKVRARECYEVAVKHHKDVVVMEPVRGGRLALLPYEAKKVLEKLSSASASSYAIRFAASFPNVKMVLSGMSSLAQMEDNVSYMKEFVPINEVEGEALKKVVAILNEEDIIPCTKCEYCLAGCPKHIEIPTLFSLYNQSVLSRESIPSLKDNYHKGVSASECISCGRCARVCPQHLEIPTLLKKVHSVLD